MPNFQGTSLNRIYRQCPSNESQFRPFTAIQVPKQEPDITRISKSYTSIPQTFTTKEKAR